MRPGVRQARTLAGTGATARARIELRNGPARSNRIIAQAAGCSPATVQYARHQLEQAGQIVLTPVRRQRPVPKRASPVRDAIARLGLEATPRQVADAAQVSYHSAWRMLRDVRALARPCGHCGKLYAPAVRLRPDGSEVLGGKAQRYCSGRCADAAYKQAHRHGPTDRAAAQAEIDRAYRGVSPVPDLRAGYCAKAPPDKQRLWISGHPADREAARYMCLSACPVLSVCRAWAVALPVADYNVYGGMEWTERMAEKHAKALAKLDFPANAQ